VVSANGGSFERNSVRVDRIAKTRREIERMKRLDEQDRAIAAEESVTAKCLLYM
jgi:hypothetical protein